MTQTQETRPMWASAIAIGFLTAAIGALMFALGMMLGGALGAIGAGLFGVGVAVGSFGGFTYFRDLRR